MSINSFALADTTKVQILKASEIKPGMTGYGLTVFEGYEPQRFESLVKGPDQMIIGFPQTPVAVVELSGGPENYQIKHVGVASGMSGSPIYVNTENGIKLLGALAYGWRFNKDPITIIQLAETMYKGAKSALNVDSQVSPQSFNDKFPHPIFFSGPFSGILDQDLLGSLTQKDLPFSIHNLAIFSNGATKGVINEADSVSVELKPGSAINVFLVTGDIELFANGTVTMVEGSDFWGFGHPFLGSGPTNLPVTVNRIITTVSNYSSSFKYPEGGGYFVGTIEQDRFWGIKGTIGKQADMIPLHFTLRNGDQKREINCAVVNVPNITNQLIASITNYTLHGGYQEFNMAQQSNGGQAVITLKLKTKDLSKEIEPLPYIAVYSRETVGGAFFKYASGLFSRVLNPLFKNGLSPELISIDIEYQTDDNFLELDAAGLDFYNAAPGDSLNLYLSLKSRDKQTEYETIVPFIIPLGIKEEEVEIQIKTGNWLDWRRIQDGEKLPVDQILTRITSFDNTSIFIKANFTKSRKNKLTVLEAKIDSVIIDKLQWQIISRYKEKRSVFIIFKQVLTPNENTLIIADEELKLKIVSKKEAKEERKEVEERKSDERKFWQIWKIFF